MEFIGAIVFIVICAIGLFIYDIENGHIWTGKK